MSDTSPKPGVLARTLTPGPGGEGSPSDPGGIQATVDHGRVSSTTVESSRPRATSRPKDQRADVLELLAVIANRHPGDPVVEAAIVDVTARSRLSTAAAQRVLAVVERDVLGLTGRGRR